jgi:hypothetical protein
MTPAPESERERIQLTEKWGLRKLHEGDPKRQRWALQYLGMDWLVISEFLGPGEGGSSLIDRELRAFADAILSRMGGDGVAEPLRVGIKSAVTWLLSRAREMNDPNAKAVLNSAAFSLGQDLKYREHELAALHTSPPAPALDVRTVEALRPFAAISLVRDHDPDGSDMIDAPDLSITPNDVRRARDVLAIHADRGKRR